MKKFYNRYKNFYHSVAQACRKKHLSKWEKRDSKILAFRRWAETAAFLQKNHEELKRQHGELLQKYREKQVDCNEEKNRIKRLKRKMTGSSKRKKIWIDLEVF